jgi:hypothetical protein
MPEVAVAPTPPPMPEMPLPPPMPEVAPAPPPMPEMPLPPPMPEVTQNTVETTPIELPDTTTALDVFASATPDVPPSDPTPPPVIDDTLLSALDTPIPSIEEPTDNALTIDDYKWKDSVLDKVMSKYDIEDKSSFLDHAMAFDHNGNRYLTKGELDDAAIAWNSALNVESDESPPDIDEEESVDDQVLTAPPIPEPIVEQSPVNDDLTPPPLPTQSDTVDLPPLPVPEQLPPLPSPESTVQVADSASIPTSPELPNEETDSYADLWKRRSDKSLPQMYGAIDRIGSGEIGTLLDRYSDRFGHELDREIIVMRRAEHESRREATPTVEVISTPDDDLDRDDDDVDDELATWLDEVEDLLRPLQRAYKSTDDKQEKKRLAPALKALIAERKSLLSVIGGDEDEEILEDLPERPPIPDVSDSTEVIASDDENVDDSFAEFCNMINNLLGKMPKDWVDQFMISESFTLFQSVASNPDGASDDERAEFFTMIDGELVSMPSEMLSEFMASPEFELYKIVGQEYGGE